MKHIVMSQIMKLYKFNCNSCPIKTIHYYIYNKIKKKNLLQDFFYLYKVYYVCLTSQGRKTVRDRKILEVHVDKGMTDGQKIVFSGEGDQEPEMEAGDLIIVLDEKEHEVSKK